MPGNPSVWKPSLRLRCRFEPTPSVWDRGKAELDEVLGGRRPTAEDLKRLTYLNGVATELPPQRVRATSYAAMRPKHGLRAEVL